MNPSLQKAATSYLFIPLATKSEVFAMPPLFSITFFKISILFKTPPTFRTQQTNNIRSYYSINFITAQQLLADIFINLYAESSIRLYKSVFSFVAFFQVIYSFLKPKNSTPTLSTVCEPHINMRLELISLYIILELLITLLRLPQESHLCGTVR